MPHRIYLAKAAATAVLEGFLFIGTLFVSTARWIANTAMDESTWDKIKGTEGALFIVVVGIVAVWFSKGQSEKKADARHTEMMRLHEENAFKLQALTAEAIKSNIAATHETANLVEAHRQLTDLLRKSPCVALALGHPMSFDRAPQVIPTQESP